MVRFFNTGGVCQILTAFWVNGVTSILAQMARKAAWVPAIPTKTEAA
ncbi:hypothetical protein L248_0411 [Schleiferilactobacillus shenzhenensis LY-73]|uniref:Uncharacterized protein n=1 Tax=Schleiferilactobacillus shenzhenensis LY-73 TaxID=1231336 RepID=U4TZK7_9LACO|nr:hypothetical protein L248_0411 [Schleiferilactobacillus shenzhenensis LY-73]